MRHLNSQVSQAGAEALPLVGHGSDRQRRSVWMCTVSPEHGGQVFGSEHMHHVESRPDFLLVYGAIFLVVFQLYFV